MIEYVRKRAQVNQDQIDRLELAGVDATAEPADDAANRRVTPRFEITAKARLTIFLGSSHSSAEEARLSRLSRSGFTRDLSLNGACVLLDRQLEPVPYRQLVGRAVRLGLELAGEEPVTFQVLGRVAWSADQHDYVALGIEFTDVLPEARDILERWCREDDGEVKRILNLWQLFVVEDQP